MKLSPEDPLSLAAIKEAQASNATVIADFVNDGLPAINGVFEGLADRKPHYSPPS
jgi:hypothetical protein